MGHIRDCHSEESETEPVDATSHRGVLGTRKRLSKCEESETEPVDNTSRRGGLGDTQETVVEEMFICIIKAINQQ